MGATTEVVDNSAPVVARPVALRDSAGHHRHVGCVNTRASFFVSGRKKQVIPAHDERGAFYWPRGTVKISDENRKSTIWAMVVGHLPAGCEEG